MLCEPELPAWGLVLEVASGKKTKAEEKGFREISIFKDGVML